MLRDAAQEEEVKLEGKRTFTYPVKGLDFTANETLAELKKAIRDIDGVTAAEFDYVEKDVTYAIDEWASEYDVLTAVLELFGRYGAELVLDGEGEETLETKGFTEEVKEEEVLPEEEPVRSERKEKKEERTGDLWERVVVLGASLVLMIVGLFLKKHETARMWVYMIGFALAGYETLYSAIEKIVKKRYIGEEAIVVVGSLGLLYLGYQASACLAVFLYASLHFLSFLKDFFAERTIDRLTDALEEGETEEEKVALQAKIDCLTNAKVRKETEKEGEKKKLILFNLIFLGAGVLVAFVPPLFRISQYGDLLRSRWLPVGIGVALLGAFGFRIESIADATYSFIFGQISAQVVCNCDGGLFDRIAQTKKVCFDGKGVVTERKGDLVGFEGDEERGMKLFSLAMKGSGHPLALLADPAETGELEEREERENRGVTGKSDGKTVVVGNKKMMEENGVEVPPYAGANTPVYIAEEGKLVGIAEISYSVKANARGAVTELSEDLGIPSELLSSDCNSAVSALAKEIGVAKSVCGASTAYKRKAVADEGILYVGDNLGDRAVREKSPMSVGMNGVSEKGISVLDGEIRRIPSLLKGCAAHRKVRKFNGVGVLAGKIALAVLLFVLALTGAGQPLWLIFALAFAVDALAVLNAFRLAKLAV